MEVPHQPCCRRCSFCNPQLYCPATCRCLCLCIECILSDPCGLQLALLDAEGLGPGKVIHHMLMSYAWPGNVRELQNIIERAIILSKDNELDIPLFPAGPHVDVKGILDDLPALDELQRRYIRHVFEYTKGKVSGLGGAAEILGMKRSSIYSRMRTLGMQK